MTDPTPVRSLDAAAPADGRATPATVLLSVTGLHFAWGERVALNGISFDVRRGEVFGLLGPNGAGKTTAISCLCGLLRPAAGELTLDGARIAPHERAADRARLGVVPQDLALYDGLTARENLALFARLFNVRDAARAVAAGLDLAGLAARADERVSTYSGGMQRRLNLAAGLLHEPLLALLDEPTVGVDPQSRHHIFEAIAALRRAGRSLVYTSHSMDEVQRLCDRIAILDEGRIVAQGTSAELAQIAGVPGADLEATFLKLTGRKLRDENA